jgi:hypothetical protein
MNKEAILQYLQELNQNWLRLASSAKYACTVAP